MDYITQNVEYVSRQTGCPDDKNFINCLRQIPALDLIRQTFPEKVLLKFPYIYAADGHSIPKMPVDLLKDGRVLRKDILLGKWTIIYDTVNIT